MDFEITVPTYEELKEAGLSGFSNFAINVSDFAIASGVECCAQRNDPTSGAVAVESCAPERIWFRKGLCPTQGSVAPKPAVDPQCYWCHGVPITDQVLRNRVDSNNIGVMPVFHNSAAGGFGAGSFNGKTVLTHNGKVVFYPQTKAEKGSTAESSLTAAHYSDRLSPLNNYDIMTLDVSPRLIGASKVEAIANKTVPFGADMYTRVTHVLNTRNNDVDQFRGGDFVGAALREFKIKKFRPVMFFKNEPIEVVPLKNGDLVCREAILALPYHNDAAEFRKYLKKYDVKHGDDIPTKGFLIGNFLYTHFHNEICKTAQVFYVSAGTIGGGVYSQYGAVPQVAKDVEGLVGKMKLGGLVRVVPEGRTGVLKHFDDVKRLATVNIDGKNRTFYADDIAVEGDGK